MKTLNVRDLETLGFKEMCPNHAIATASARLTFSDVLLSVAFVRRRGADERGIASPRQLERVRRRWSSCGQRSIGTEQLYQLTGMSSWHGLHAESVPRL